VRTLRAIQFQEDSGPLAHPVRPDSYIEISNFYTATVYNKGAELIRMMRTLLGPEKFRAGTDLYFERHDGEAATCDDFVRALEDASGDRSLASSNSGIRRPARRMCKRGSSRTARAVLHLSQERAADAGPAGQEADGDTAEDRADRRAERGRDRARTLILLDSAEQVVKFYGLSEPALLSINRGFSAPIIVDVERGPGELKKLAATDTDPFARYEALQELMMSWLSASVRGEPAEIEPVIGAIANTLALERARFRVQG
jgi:aminopeptidase N